MTSARRLVPLVLFALPLPARAQQEVSRYEALYGQPVDVSLYDLVQNPGAYVGRAVRTKGRLEMGASLRDSYLLRDAFAGSVYLIPVPEVARYFLDDARRWLGRDLEVVGVFGEGGTQDSISDPGGPRGRIQFWEYVGPPDEVDKSKLAKAQALTLEELVSRPGRADGRTVRVIGKFRGKNLYGDLPSRSQRATADWVIKDEVWAAWITGKKPKGDGWELDPSLRRDTGKWVEVVGRVETRGGVSYIKAMSLALSAPPTPTAKVEAPPPPPPRPKLPPVVVFSLPLDGETEVAPTDRFVVQFSNDMNAGTFKGHVVLRYAGPRRPGDQAFDGLKLSYEEGRRALTVDPGDLLRPGRVVEVLLLPGITDLDGQELVPRKQGYLAPEGAVDVLRWRISLLGS